MESHKRVQHSSHRDKRKQARGYTTDSIAEVQQSNGKPTEDDGKVKPREERPLVCEEHLYFPGLVIKEIRIEEEGRKDLRLDTGGKSNALSWSALEERLGGHRRVRCMKNWS